MHASPSYQPLRRTSYSAAGTALAARSSRRFKSIPSDDPTTDAAGARRLKKRARDHARIRALLHVHGPWPLHCIALVPFLWSHRITWMGPGIHKLRPTHARAVQGLHDGGGAGKPRAGILVPIPPPGPRPDAYGACECSSLMHVISQPVHSEIGIYTVYASTPIVHLFRTMQREKSKC